MKRFHALRAQWERVRAVRADIRATRALAEHLVVANDDIRETVTVSRVHVDAITARLDELAAQIDELDAARAADHRHLIDVLRVVRDDDATARERLWELRATEAYARAYDESDPLVSIVVTTYRNWPLMRDRCLPSVLAQTHENFECIVVGDAAPPEAEDVVASFKDDRLRFINLPYRGPYPARPEDAWLVSGTTPFNTGCAIARGQWIASNSDDDALRPDHLRTLLALARETRAEVAYGTIAQIEPGDRTTRLGGFPPAPGQWGIQCSLLHAGLRFMPLQPTEWLFGIPNDSSLLERMLRIGVRFSMTEDPVVDYYPSSLWSDRLTRTEF